MALETEKKTGFHGRDECEMARKLAKLLNMGRKVNVGTTIEWSQHRYIIEY
jgi:hypothetical protein